MSKSREEVVCRMASMIGLCDILGHNSVNLTVEDLAVFDGVDPAVAELVAADIEYDEAQDELVAAKREKGNWRVNPLGHSHPAVLRVRAAKERRAAALARLKGGV